jgi:hypothetical protein
MFDSAEISAVSNKMRALTPLSCRFRPGKICFDAQLDGKIRFFFEVCEITKVRGRLLDKRT